jgi:protein-S-isoprenylcysteine O-methyltransferase Ste14
MTATTPVGPRLLAALCGIANHGLFALAIASMAMALWHGLANGAGSAHGWPALFANLALVLQFPLLHSALLTRAGARALVRVLPQPYGRTLLTTTYACTASLQLLLTFWAWSPSGVVLWQPTGPALVIHGVVFAACWLFLLKAIVDGGFAVHTGALGWWSLLRGRPVRYPTFSSQGTFAVCRQPIYLAFALLLWTAPTWTLDRLLLGIPWTAYCVFGPLRKEQRYLARHGDAYRAYQQRVAYFVPSFRRP